jgi:hypothetical protein
MTFDGQANTLEAVPFSIPDLHVAGGVLQRWWTMRHVPVIKPDGQIEFIMQNPIDVTEMVEANHLKDIISGELPAGQRIAAVAVA